MFKYNSFLTADVNLLWKDVNFFPIALPFLLYWVLILPIIFTFYYFTNKGNMLN